MILKLETKTKSGCWEFIGKIEKIETGWHKEIPPEPDLPFTMRKIIAFLENTTTEILYVQDEKVYLLNDEGKTIERIN